MSDVSPGGFAPPPPPGAPPGPGWWQASDGNWYPPQQQPQLQQAYLGYGGLPAPVGTNGLAIAALVCAFVFAPAAVPFGHIALSQIKQSGEAGRGMAIAGLVIGYISIAVGIFLVVALIVFANEVDDNFRIEGSR